MRISGIAWTRTTSDTSFCEEPALPRSADEEQGERARPSDHREGQEAAAVALGQLSQAAEGIEQHESPKSSRRPNDPSDNPDLLGEPLCDQLEDCPVTHPQRCHTGREQEGAQVKPREGRTAQADSLFS